jgi:nicotinate-nucleotide adenylyltransferase
MKGDAQRVRKIALMGGTFNPIHNGHLIIAEMVRSQYHMDHVLFLPTGDPPHKSSSVLIENSHRYAMVMLAINKNPYFHVSNMEMERGGTTYTVDTLRELRKIYPPDRYELYYIIGTDTLLELHTWKDFQELFQYTEFIAVNRPGISSESVLDKVHQLEHRYGKKVEITVSCPSFEVSSTDIRRRIQEGRSIRYLVPEEVEAYISKNGLYLKK